MRPAAEPGKADQALFLRNRAGARFRLGGFDPAAPAAWIAASPLAKDNDRRWCGRTSPPCRRTLCPEPFWRCASSSMGMAASRQRWCRQARYGPSSSRRCCEVHRLPSPTAETLSRVPVRAASGWPLAGVSASQSTARITEMCLWCGPRELLRHHNRRRAGDQENLAQRCKSIRAFEAPSRPQQHHGA